MKELTALLQSEIRPALGVTEVGAIALAAARAAAEAKGKLQSIRVKMNGGMYKNAFSCAIPGTEETGCLLSALLGAVCGDWKKGLLCLEGVTQADVEKVQSMGIAVICSVAQEHDEIYILAEAEGTEGKGRALITDTHSHIAQVWQDDTEIFHDTASAQTESTTTDFDKFQISDFVEYVQSVDLEEIAFLQDMIDMNVALAEAGKQGVGLSLGKTLLHFQQAGMLYDDTILQAQLLTTAAMDARLAGLPLPAMSIVGSGSHGILCSLPVVSFGRSRQKSEGDILRAVALSGLVTIYSKHYTGRLSSLCGCVLGGGSGAAAGIVYLMGGDSAAVSTAIDAMAANLTGMICDGGSVGCALKAYSGVQAAFLSAMLACTHTAFPHPLGVVGRNAEQTTYHLGRVSQEGMSQKDKTILSIMEQK